MMIQLMTTEGDPVWLNTAHIVRIKPLANGSHIDLSDHRLVAMVKEGPWQIIGMMQVPKQG